MLKCGNNRVWMDPDRTEEIAKAVTRKDVRILIQGGAIDSKQIKGISRGRKKIIKQQKHKGRRRGHGSGAALTDGAALGAVATPLSRDPPLRTIPRTIRRGHPGRIPDWSSRCPPSPGTESRRARSPRPARCSSQRSTPRSGGRCSHRCCCPRNRTNRRRIRTSFPPTRHPHRNRHSHQSLGLRLIRFCHRNRNHRRRCRPPIHRNR